MYQYCFHLRQSFSTWRLYHYIKLGFHYRKFSFNSGINASELKWCSHLEMQLWSLLVQISNLGSHSTMFPVSFEVSSAVSICLPTLQIRGSSPCRQIQIPYQALGWHSLGRSSEFGGAHYRQNALWPFCTQNLATNSDFEYKQSHVFQIQSSLPQLATADASSCLVAGSLSYGPVIPLSPTKNTIKG